MSDLVSRADAIEAVNMLDIFPPTKDAVARELMALQSAEAEQVTGKLKNPCDSLLTDDSAECKEHKSKLESADTNQTNSRLIGANALMDLLKARKRFFIDAYGGFHYMSEKDKARCDEIDACIASIVNAPTASADAVHGEWIIHGEPPWLVRECSECGTKWYQWSGDSNPNYCGHCGARMKGGAE